MTRGDGIVIGLALVLCVAIWAGFYLIPKDNSALTAVVRVNGKEIEKLSASGSALAQKQVTLPGGVATIEYGQGKVRVLPVPDHYCPDGICWKTGWVSRPGQSIVCVPNHMTITLEGASDGVDSVLR